jgi:hypothetical protein
MCCLRVSQPAPITSFVNINWLLFTVEKEFVLCEVETDFVYISLIVASLCALTKQNVMYITVSSKKYNFIFVI